MKDRFEITRKPIKGIFELVIKVKEVFKLRTKLGSDIVQVKIGYKSTPGGTVMDEAPVKETVNGKQDQVISLSEQRKHKG